MKILIILLLCFFWGDFTFAQNINLLSNFEGIWIAKPFYDSFEKTKNIRKSKDVFPAEFPVGLRINLKEMYNDTLNIGYSVLHDHMVHPEVSRYYLPKDTSLKGEALALYLESDDKSNKDFFRRVYEQGYFSVPTKELVKNNINIGNIPFFNIESQTSFIKFYEKDSVKTIFIYRLANDSIPADTIFFTKTNLNITDNYSNPNPLYYYTKNRVLVGKYNLFNTSGVLLSNSFEIKNNGRIIGYKNFVNKKIVYSTDIYCGFPWSFNTVEIFCEEDSEKCSGNRKSFIFEQLSNGDKLLYKYDWDEVIAIEFQKNKSKIQPLYILKPRK